MNTENLTKGEKFVLDWQYNRLGSFYNALAIAISKADTENTNRLRMAFPDEVDAMVKFSTEYGWYPELEKRAGIRKWEKNNEWSIIWITERTRRKVEKKPLSEIKEYTHNMGL